MINVEPAYRDWNVTLMNKEFLKNGFIGIFIKGLGASSAFLLTIVLTRKLGVEQSGVFFLCFSIVSILSVISRLGLDNVILRFVGENKHTGDFEFSWLVVSKAIKITLLSSLIVCLLAIAFSDEVTQYIFKDAAINSGLVLLSPYIIFLSIFTIYAMALQGNGNSIFSTLVLNIFTNIFVALICLFISSINVGNVIAILLSAGFMNCLLAYLLLRSKIILRSEKNKQQTQENIQISKLLQSSLPLLWFMLLGQLIQWSGQIFLGIWSTIEDVALFTTAQRTALLTSFILMAVNIVVAPKFASLYKLNNFKELKSLSDTTMKFVSIISIPIFLTLFIFSTEIMSLFGTGFEKSSFLLRVLLVGQLVNVLTGPVNYLLAMTGGERFLLKSSLISGAFILIFSILIIPIWGSLGAAVVIACGVILQNLLGAYFVRIKLGFTPFLTWRTSSAFDK